MASWSLGKALSDTSSAPGAAPSTTKLQVLPLANGAVYTTLPCAAIELASSEASPPLTLGATPSPVKSAWSTITWEPLARWKFGWSTSMPSATKATFTPAPVIPREAAVGAAFGTLLLALMVWGACGSSSTAGEPSSWQTWPPVEVRGREADLVTADIACALTAGVGVVNSRWAVAFGTTSATPGLAARRASSAGDTVALTALRRV